MGASFNSPPGIIPTDDKIPERQRPRGSRGKTATPAPTMLTT